MFNWRFEDSWWHRYSKFFVSLRFSCTTSKRESKRSIAKWRQLTSYPQWRLSRMRMLSRSFIIIVRISQTIPYVNLRCKFLPVTYRCELLNLWCYSHLLEGSFSIPSILPFMAYQFPSLEHIASFWWCWWLYRAIQVAQGLGLRTILWDYDTNDRQLVASWRNVWCYSIVDDMSHKPPTHSASP